MKLFQQLLVAPAALGLMAPIAANAAELSINDVSGYSASAEQVQGISQFSDVYPTDWAYQALTKLRQRHGCTAANPSGSMTRYEAAALLNQCLSNIAEVNQEEQSLIDEFSPELAVIKGRLDTVQAGVFDDSFSATTKIGGESIWVIGAVDEHRDGCNNNAAGGGCTNGGTTDVNEATTFSYKHTFEVETSFTGSDLLFSAFEAGRSQGPLASGGAAALESAFDSGGNHHVAMERLYYQFPIGSDFTATVGPRVRQDDMLGVWPSDYPSDSVLDVLTYAGANDAYSLAEGAGASVTYSKDRYSASLVWVGSEPTDADSDTGGIFTDAGSDDVTLQLGYLGDNFTIAYAYTYADGGEPNDEPSTDDYEAHGISGVYQVNADGTWGDVLPSSISLGFGWSSPDNALDADDVEDEDTWSMGMIWNDVWREGYNLGIAYGTAEGHRDDDPYDNPMAYEIYYSMAITDNITVTPALFGMERNSNPNITGGIVKTTFSF